MRKKVKELLILPLLLVLGWAISYPLDPLSSYLIRPVAWIAFLMLSPFYNVVLSGNVIVGNGVAVRVIDLCTPVPEFGIVLAYILLTWKGLRDVLVAILSFIILLLFDGLKVAVMFVLLGKGYSWVIYHDLNSYVIFFLAFLSILIIREKV